MMIHDSWPFRVIRGLGPFILLYLAIAFVVGIVAFFVYGGIWPVIAIAIIVVLFALSLWALKESGETKEMKR